MIKKQIDICKYVKFHSLNSKLFTSISLMWDSQQYITPNMFFCSKQNSESRFMVQYKYRIN